MLDDFIFRAGISGFGIAISAGLLGCFVNWKRMAYFGDAMSHAAILGVALSLVTSIAPTFAVLITTLALSFLLLTLTKQGQSTDSSLGLISHGALATGLLLISFIPNRNFSIEGYLFGSILTVSKVDLAVIWISTALITTTLTWRWSKLLLSTLSPDLAAAHGINAQKENLIFTLLLALLVALSIKITGALLITALLIIPCASARKLSNTPETMALISVLFAIISTTLGLYTSLTFDTLTGPSMICTALAIFILCTVSKGIWQKNRG